MEHRDIEETFNKYISQVKFINEDTKSLLKLAFTLYKNKDYVSSLHIFTPQFESVFLQMSSKYGIDTISLNRGDEISTQNRTLSEKHLNSEEYQSVWGEDLCEQIKFVLFKSNGYALRHKVAHGYISLRECNEDSVNTVLHLILKLYSKVIHDHVSTEQKHL
jgi:hypothetical protein